MYILFQRVNLNITHASSSKAPPPQKNVKNVQIVRKKTYTLTKASIKNIKERIAARMFSRRLFGDQEARMHKWC